MRVSVENASQIERRMTVAVPADEMESEIATRLVKLARSVKMPGFRPGKVPKHLVESRYGNQLLEEVASDLINNSYRDALGKEGLVPAGNPEIETSKIERGSDLEYVATFDIFPEIPNPHLTDYKVEKPQCEITDDDIDRTIERIRKGRVDWQTKPDGAADKDRVTIDFTGKIDGEVFPGGESKDYPVVLGNGALLPDFEKELQGAKTGDERSFSLTFPEDYPGGEVAGKEATFEVTVKSVEAPQLSEINEEFIKSFGVEEGTEKALRDEVKQNLQRELEGRVRTHLRDQVMKGLLESNDIPLPKQMVEEEITRAIENNRAMMAQQGINAPPDIDRGLFADEAKRRVTLGLVVRTIVENHNLQPDAGLVRARIEEMAAGYEQPEQFVQWYYSDEKRLDQVQAMVLEEQVVEKLLSEASVEEKSMPLDDFMNKAADTTDENDDTEEG